MTKRMKDWWSERGSASLEALVSLVTLVIAVAFVYSQVQVILCENILQHAVNNMALEVSTYSYILDRMGVVRHDEGEEVKELNNNVDKIMEDYTNALSKLNTIGGSTSLDELKQNTQNTVDAGKGLMGSVKLLFDGIQKEGAAEKLLKAGLDEGVGLIMNGVLNNAYYPQRVSAYLPCNVNDFKKKYGIKDLDFSMSEFMSGTTNNTILVVVKVEIDSKFAMFPIKRTIVKSAFTAVWMVDPKAVS